MGNSSTYRELENTYNTLTLVNTTRNPVYIAMDTCRARLVDGYVLSQWDTAKHTLQPGGAISAEAMAGYMAYVNIHGEVSDKLVFTTIDFRVTEGQMFVDITENGRGYVLNGVVADSRYSTQMHHSCVTCDCYACGVYSCCNTFPFIWCLCCMSDPDCWR